MSDILTIHSETADERDRQILGLALSIEDGWDFRAGDPEIYANEQRLVVPGGKVLDIGMGGARTSLFFAMHGMDVHGYDLDRDGVEFVNDFGAKFDIPIHAEHADVTEVDMGENLYDVVVLSQTFVHFPSTAAAYEVLDKAIHATKPGGHIYLRAVGTRDAEFTDAPNRWNAIPSQDDPNVYYEDCACSGEWQVEPHLFLEPVELMAHLETHGIQTVHSQIAPTDGQMNVMYAEDWHVASPPGYDRQMITLIGQKRAEL